MLCVDASGGSASQAEKEEADARSIYVGNVRFTSFILFHFIRIFLGEDVIQSCLSCFLLAFISYSISCKKLFFSLKN